MDEQLEKTFDVQRAAEKKIDKFFQRGPFIYGILSAFALAMFVGGAWTAVLQYRLNKEEEFTVQLKSDNGIGILEEVHNNRKDAQRNSKQIRVLNRKVVGIPDPGNDDD